MNITMNISEYEKSLAWMDINIATLQNIVSSVCTMYGIKYMDDMYSLGDNDFESGYWIQFEDNTRFVISGEYDDSIDSSQRIITCMKNDLVLYEVNCTTSENSMFTGLKPIFIDFTNCILDYIMHSVSSNSIITLKAGE
jgi:hypothetical protein